MKIAASLVAATLLVIAGPAAAQTIPESAPLAAAAPAPAPVTPSFKKVLKDTGGDFTRLASADSARWLVIGATASLLARPEDARISGLMGRQTLKDPFGSGQLIGSLPFQMGSALTAYTIGRIAGSSRTAQVGAELFRAQAVAQVTTYAIKYSTRRTRPDGTSFSFPSGHTSVTFASATVLQRNFGWKTGIPAYGVAAYVAGSRLQTRRHHLSDVAFGAALGILAGRTVTVGRGKSRLALGPAAVPGGAGVTFTLVGRQPTR